MEENAQAQEKKEQYNRIVVVAYDDSDMSTHAFNYAVDNLLRDDDHLRLIHVQPYHEVVDVVAAAHVAVPVYSAGKVRQESYDLAKKYAALCQERGIRNFKEDVILEDGSAGAAICEYMQGLESENAMLVLGSRELGFFGRAFIGSTSEHCVRHCHCPVTVIKMPKNE